MTRLYRALLSQDKKSLNKMALRKPGRKTRSLDENNRSTKDNEKNSNLREREFVNDLIIKKKVYPE